MTDKVDLARFCRELDQRLAGLMASFRQLHQAASDTDDGALQAFFRELFSLQKYFQEHVDQLSHAPAATETNRERHFEWLYKSSLILNTARDAPALLELALDTLLEMSGCRRGFIATLDEEGGFSFIAARNFKRENIPDPEREISRTVIHKALRLRTEVKLESHEGDRSLLQRTSFIRQQGAPLICVPVFIDHEPKAVIYLDQFDAGASVTGFNLVKNFSVQLGAFMKNASQFTALRASREQLLESLKGQYRFDRIIGRDTTMLKVLKTIAKIAPTDAPVLVQGETGTGKDLAARAVHENSSRSDGPFVEVDCGALPASLIESELFGFVRGAFTGAHENKTGLLEAANGGTLFLDEINNLPLDSQTRLLRVLQQQRVRRIGETRERPVDFRLIAASSRDVGEMVRAETFRRDLLYRINTVTLELPPLRRRKEDIFILAMNFLEKYCQQHERGPLNLSPEAMTALECHAWPGNVRELEHVIERAVILSEGSQLVPGDLPAEFHVEAPESEVSDTTSLEDFTNQARRRYIAKVLRDCGGVKVEAARILQINRSYLFQLIKQLGLAENETDN